MILFGGGSSNRTRFSSIYILDWETKIWRELDLNEENIAPLERTYHVAEFSYPYLVIFGGEGFADMDDLWVFNFTTERWTEVKIN